MTLEQFMRLSTEAKQRNIDPFELQVFQEEQSASVKEYVNLVQRDKAQQEFDTLSRGPINNYKGFSQQRKKKPGKRLGTSLPKALE